MWFFNGNTITQPITAQRLTLTTDSFISRSVRGGFLVLFSGVASSGDQYTLRECVGFSYKKDGTLKLATVEHDYGPTSLLGLSPNETVIWDSGIPIASPAPTVGPDGGSISVSSYSINGGFGWHELAARQAIILSAEPRRLLSDFRVSHHQQYHLVHHLLLAVWWRRDRGRPDIVATESRVAILAPFYRRVRHIINT